jgi:hypothetical protein
MDEEAKATLAAASAAEQAALLESKQAEVLDLQRALSKEIKKQEEEVPNATLCYIALVQDQTSMQD